MTMVLTHYKTHPANAPGNFDVVAVTKQYESNINYKEVFREVVVANVSHEYGEMLCRELTKRDHNWPISGERIAPFNSKTFSIVNSVSRWITNWIGPNAADWGERVDNPISY